jgi:hypothetical protein
VDIKIEETDEFKFVMRFVNEFESTEKPKSAVQYLRYAGHGIGIIQGVIARHFIRAARKSVTQEFRNKMLQHPLNSKRYNEMNQQSRALRNTYGNFNPEVAEWFIEDQEGKIILSVLLKNVLSVNELERIVAKSEKWRAFFLRAKKEFGDDIGGGWNLEYPMAMEGLALRANPAIDRDYKDTGRGVKIVTYEGEFDGLLVDGFKRTEEFDIPEELVLNNIGGELAKTLIGRRVDYHLDQASRTDLGYVFRGSLIRIL